MGRKVFWTKTLPIYYPYVLNERKIKSGKFASSGSRYFPIKRYDHFILLFKFIVDLSLYEYHVADSKE